MFIDIVRNLEMAPLDKTILHRLAEVYESNLPGSLYLNHYQLSAEYGYPHDKWKQFLKIKEVDRLVMSEIAQITEIAAREAIQRLQSGKASAQDISAAKELLSTSRLLRQKTNQRQKIVITRIPEKVKDHAE